MTCEYCDHFQYVGYTLKGDNMGQCRFNPPTKEGWPTVSKDDWCGKYEQKDTGEKK